MLGERARRACSTPHLWQADGVEKPPPIDREALEAWLEESGERIAAMVDPAHHTFLDLYLRRADVLHLLRAEPTAVVEELVRAARCYAAHGEMYLHRWPHSRVRQRRLAPLELALISREREVMESIVHAMGAQTMTLLAGLADDALSAEVRVITGGTFGATPSGPATALGALALLYWACMSALASGDMTGLEAARLQARVVLDAFELPTEGAPGRMVAAHGMLAALTPLDGVAFESCWAAHLEASAADAPLALDRGAIAIGCVAAVAGYLPGQGSGASEQSSRHAAYVRVASEDTA